MCDDSEKIRRDNVKLTAENKALKHQLTVLKEIEELRSLKCSHSAPAHGQKPNSSPTSGLSTTGTAERGAPLSHSAEQSSPRANRQLSPTLEIFLRLSLSDDSPTEGYKSTLSRPEPAKVLSYCRTAELFESSHPNVSCVPYRETMNSQLSDSKAQPTIKKILLSEIETSDKSKKLLLEEGNKTQVFYMNEVNSFSGQERNGRMIGEIAFQLDRRILMHVFPELTRLYGYTVSNIPSKIKQTAINPLDGTMNQAKWKEMIQRYTALLAKLEKLSYKPGVHAGFSEFLVNTYGILKQRPNTYSSNTCNPVVLRRLFIDMVPAKFLQDALILLNCLCQLSRNDKKPLLAW
ncbi:speriolin-like protein [Hypanus sabinus]|uniref:speriolin-like protein n=1 Tax=Hypanus sabinus TaxID=79690 RepID=UPI0028C48446|nr:speriolin-like protein [Hypanus sabinus]